MHTDFYTLLSTLHDPDPRLHSRPQSTDHTASTRAPKVSPCLKVIVPELRLDAEVQPLEDGVDGALVESQLAQRSCVALAVARVGGARVQLAHVDDGAGALDIEEALALVVYQLLVPDGHDEVGARVGRGEPRLRPPRARLHQVGRVPPVLPPVVVLDVHLVGVALLSGADRPRAWPELSHHKVVDCRESAVVLAVPRVGKEPS
eukprot:scaffold91968_cov60-Phaeocystis_antarctica.AAC.1